jgi:hypothetical protein
LKNHLAIFYAKMIHNNLIKNLIMKKTLTILIIAFTYASSLFAQKTKSDEIFDTYRFSLYAGPSFNSMKPTASVAENYEVKKNGGQIGFSFGINADYHLTERYTLYTGLGMDWRGGKINSNLPTGATIPSKYVKGANVKYNTQYLTIPIGLKMTATTFDKIKIQVLTGFDLGILLAQKGDATLYTKNTITGNDTILNFEKQKLGGLATVVPITLGWSLGIGGEYDLNGKNAIMAQLIYRNGFVDITNPKTNEEGKRFSDGNIRSNTLAIRIGYAF